MNISQLVEIQYMAEFKKSGGFRGGNGGGGFSRGGAERPRFANKGFSGGRDRDQGDRPVQMFSATCAECRKTCEVPFRPNGEKPVYCRDCFGEKRGSPQGDRRDAMPAGRPAPRDFGSRDRDSTSAPAHKPQEDRRIDELKRQVETLGYKLDTITKMLESVTRTATTQVATSEVTKPEVKKVVSTLSKVVKKVAKKAAKTRK